MQKAQSDKIFRNGWELASAQVRTLLVTALVMILGALHVVAADPLPSWNEGATKQSILNFVTRVTTAGSPEFVAPAERIAVFDNDGTLWCEQPTYTQFLFGMDRMKVLAPKFPELAEKQPFKAALAGDLDGVVATGVHGLIELTAATHGGLTAEEFEQIVNTWLATARHPRFQKPFNDCVYEPMREVIRLLQTNQFKTYIVSGGALEFMRPWTAKVYGIPPEQVIGSTVKTKLEMRDGRAVIVRSPEIELLNDKAEKVLSIARVIGRRPIAAFGNSDGDLPMLQWTAAGSGARLCLYVHHTDAEREYAYDRAATTGRLDKGLDEAKVRGWSVANIKRDWKRVFPFE